MKKKARGRRNQFLKATHLFQTLNYFDDITILASIKADKLYSIEFTIN